MFNQILDQIIPILITATVGILVAIIKSVGDAVISYIEAKKAEIVVKVGVAKYNQQLTFARSMWNVVEENFRLSGIVGNIILQKQEMFDKLVKEKFPSVTDEQIILLRQSIAGEVNEGKEVIASPAEIKEEIVIAE